MDLALEAGHTTLLTHDGLGVHVEVGHSWGDRKGEVDTLWRCRRRELRGSPSEEQSLLEAGQ